ncbi:MAG: hypothetical protein JWN32_3346, partial [Solirubrobacterales bacterium]|nr:hypothetical protein [Solirubrobacterales bacterium]
MIGFKDGARRMSIATSAALVGLGAVSVSALADGSGTTPDPCTDPSATAPDPSVTTPCPATTPTDAATTTVTEAPPAATPTPTITAAPIQPTPPVSATPTETAPSPAPPTTPAQQKRRAAPRRAIRTTVPHRQGARHLAKSGKSHRLHHRHGKHDGSGRRAGGTLYLPNRLPDPTPPAARVDRRFMRTLRAAAHRAGVDWALVLGVLRANGHQD